nr:retrotransposon protein, putative, Ty1-copia subclass [Tanacetum cinerariifolium]
MPEPKQTVRLSEEGHWKRNCPMYLVELMKKKKKIRGQNVASTSSVSMNNMLYFNAITVNGIYEIDMRDSTLPIVNSMYSISNKRTKSNLDSTYLWHCRLAHINNKHIKKLQHDGLLKSTDNESFDQCVSCISGKMTRKPFSHKTEKVKDVLGLIHTDVCGPLRHVSKKGASYFITFTDDYSRYGYVYLLKHIHEVFKPFKVFKSEVENQLEKTIKAIRSDRGDFLEKDFILQKESGRIIELEDEDILPSENTSEHPIEEESLAPIVSQEEDVILVRRSRLIQIDYALMLKLKNITALSDPEFEKWLVAMNVEMQSMYDNKVWRLVVLLPNAKVVNSKWIYKKKSDMDGKHSSSVDHGKLVDDA